MSYDPRLGESPYLGMDADETSLGEQAPDTAGEPLTRRIDPRERSLDPVAEPLTRRIEPGEGRRAARPATRGADPMPTTVRRPQRVAESPARPRPLVREVPRAVPSPSQEPYQPPRASRSTLPDRIAATLGALSLHLAALCLRAAAIVMSGVVVASAVLTDAYRVALVEVLGRLSWLLSFPMISGRFVTETPFGGILRGDLVIASIILFCMDWLCMRFSTSLRERRERGA